MESRLKKPNRQVLSFTGHEEVENRRVRHVPAAYDLFVRVALNGPRTRTVGRERNRPRLGRDEARGGAGRAGELGDLGRGLTVELLRVLRYQRTGRERYGRIDDGVALASERNEEREHRDDQCRGWLPHVIRLLLGLSPPCEPTVVGCANTPRSRSVTPEPPRSGEDGVGDRPPPRGQQGASSSSLATDCAPVAHQSPSESGPFGRT